MDYTYRERECSFFDDNPNFNIMVFATLCGMIALAYIAESEIFHRIVIRFRVMQLNREVDGYLSSLRYFIGESDMVLDMT